MSANPNAGVVTVELPCGYLSEGKLHKDAEIVPMTGLIRKMIARPEIRQSPAKVIDTLLIQCVKSIGPASRVRKDVTDRLFLGDRDFLVLEIRKASLGDRVTSILQCDSCNAKLEVGVDISTEVKIKKLTDVPHKIEDKFVTFEIQSDNPEVNAKFRLPTGEDQHAVSHLYRKNPVEANYALYQRCLVEWNGVPSNECDPRLFDSLPLRVIDYVDSQFMEFLPGPDMRVPVDCVECGKEMILAMESSDFLFPLPRRERT
jgi:hypothetical protein